MNLSDDLFKRNLEMFLALLGPTLEIDEKPSNLIEVCGDRQEIIAYLVLNSALMKNDAKIKKHLLHAAKIMPVVARPTDVTKTVMDVSRVAAQNAQIIETLHKIFGSELATSPLAKQFESARYQLAIQTTSRGMTDETIFDRVLSA